MDRTVKLSRVQTVLDDLTYPLPREDAVRQLSAVTVRLADGEENLGELIEGSNDPTFESRDDLENEIFSLLPREAVGEPYQSEGEG